MLCLLYDQSQQNDFELYVLNGTTFSNLYIHVDNFQVRMQLNEGLQCSFYQQAVSIDVEQGNYIPLGEVRKTLVASPDIDGAFN